MNPSPSVSDSAGTALQPLGQDVRTLLSLMVPLLTGSVLASLTILANTVIVGRSESNGLLLSGLFLPFSMLMVSVIESLRAALTVYATQAEDDRGMRLMVCGFAAEGAVLMLLVAAAVTALGGLIFRRLDAPQETLAYAARFVTWMQVASAVLVAGVLANAAVFARGLARRALATSIAANLVNLGVTSACAFLLQQGAFGAVWGTLAAGSVMFIVSFASLPSAAGSWTHWQAAVGRVFKMTRAIALPVFGSYLVLSVYAAALNDVLMSIGPDAVAGFGVANRLQSLLMMPAAALGTALAIRAGGMHRGSGGDVGVARLVGRALWFGLVLYALISAVTVAAQPFITPLMAGAEAASVLRDYLLIVGPSFLFFGPMLAMLIYLEQAGHGRLALPFNVISLAITFAVVYAVASRRHQVHDVFIAIAACNALTAMVLFAIVRRRAVHRPAPSLVHGGSQ